MATVHPSIQSMTEHAFDTLPDEKQLMHFKSFDTAGAPVHGVVTDRRLILRATEGLCDFPFNMFCVCFKTETDSSYAIMDLKNVQPYVTDGCAANMMSTMFDLATKYPMFCCCLPKMLPHGIRLGFSRPAGDYVPFWNFWPLWSVGTGNSFQALRLQMHKEDAIKLRGILSTHSQAKGLGYTKIDKA